VLVSGADLTDAQPGFDQRTSQPIVSFKFNSNRRAQIRRGHQANVGKPFAIVLDNKVISAPVIREPITRRLRARFPAISPCSRPTISRSCCAPARCRRR
jgi:preprotein translocase subunit SecD